MGCHGSAHTVRRPESIRALGPRVPPPAPRSPLPQPSATLLSGRPRRADSQLPAAASSAPRPQRRLRPPEPPLAPSLTDIRAPGAAGRTAPRSSPGTGAAHRPGALSGTSRPPDASPPPAAGSPLSVGSHFKGETHGPRLPSRCPSSPGPPSRGRRGGTARLLLRAARLAGSAFSPAVQARAPGTPALRLGPRRPGPGAAGLCGESAAQHRPRCFWPLPLPNLPSETSEIRKQYCFNFAFSFEFGTQRQVFTQRLPSWGSMRITQKTTIRGSPLVN